MSYEEVLRYLCVNTFRGRWNTTNKATSGRIATELPSAARITTATCWRLALCTIKSPAEAGDCGSEGAQSYEDAEVQMGTGFGLLLMKLSDWAAVLYFPFAAMGILGVLFAQRFER